MEIVTKISEDVADIIDLQRIDHNAAYHVNKYHSALKVESGEHYLLYNSLTREMLYITPDEANCLVTNNYENHVFLRDYFISHWFLINDNCDEQTIANMIKNKLIDQKHMEKYFSHFTILTTTDCNARCTYCYEMGMPRIKMSLDTAEQVANYIIKHAQPDTAIKINWFGGEPLYNMEVIDYITGRLKENNVRFYSSAISNGYLFDETVVARAVEKWNLSNVQITIDGMNDAYKKTKRFIYDDPDPFNTVIQNIGHLLDHKVFVTIRMNVSKDNYKELYKAADYLIDKFYDPVHFGVYATPLFEDTHYNTLIETKDDKDLRYGYIEELQNHILSRRSLPNSRFSFNERVKTCYCQANNPNAVLINPNGELCKCEHMPYTSVFGSVFDDNQYIDHEELERWKDLRSDLPICSDCAYYPKCDHIARCEVFGVCNEHKKHNRITEMNFGILCVYNDFMKNKKREQEVLSNEQIDNGV